MLKGGTSVQWVAAEEGGVSGGGGYRILFYVGCHWSQLRKICTK